MRRPEYEALYGFTSRIVKALRRTSIEAQNRIYNLHPA